MTTHHAHVLVRRRLLLLAAAVLVLGIPSTAPAQIFPPGSTVQGKPIAEWTGEFWEWLASIDASQDPRGDPTGELAHINNDGPVFFIAGTAGGDATRSFTVPVDRPLLVPLVNANYTRSPEEVDANDIPVFASGDPVDGVRPADPDFIRDFLAGFLDDPEDLVFELDGVGLTAEEALGHRESTTFTIDVTNPNNALGEPVGPWSESYADGYWVMLEPLARGEHSLRLGGSLPAVDFSTGVTATLIAVPEPSAVWLVVIGLTAAVCLNNLFPRST